MPHVINPKECAICGACEAECPTGAITLHTSMRYCVIEPAQCNDCGDCVEVCPTQAVSREEDDEAVVEAAS